MVATRVLRGSAVQMGAVMRWYPDGAARERRVIGPLDTPKFTCYYGRQGHFVPNTTGFVEEGLDLLT